MNYYKLYIKAPNKMFTIRNRPVRSPFEINITDEDLSLVKSRIKFYGLLEKEFSIEKLNNIEEDQKKDYSSYIQPERNSDTNERNDIEQRSSEIFSKNGVIYEPKKKIINVNKRTRYKKQNTILETDLLSTNSQDKIEYNIIDEGEVKIEELSTKSSSILETFLNK